MVQAISDFWNNQIYTASFLASLISGFITSFIFLFSLLFFFRPRVKISPVIAMDVDEYDDQEPKRLCWTFKIVNVSFFSAFDMKIEVCQKIPFYGPNGSLNYGIIRFTLLKDEYTYIAPYKIRWKKKEYYDNAVWIITYDDVALALELRKASVIELRLICKHGLTGLGSIKRQKYTLSDMTMGTFCSGTTFDTKKYNKIDVL